MALTGIMVPGSPTGNLGRTIKLQGFAHFLPFQTKKRKA